MSYNVREIQLISWIGNRNGKVLHFNIMIVHPARIFTMLDIYTVYTPRVSSVTSLYYHYMFWPSWAIIR
jgi:hypothetical protein